MSVLCLFVHVLCANVLRPLSGIFLTFCVRRSVFFGDDKLATLSNKQTLSFILCLSPRCKV